MRFSTPTLLLASAAAIASLSGSATAQPGPHEPGTKPKNPFTPLEHRVAYHTPSAMMVSWNTFTHLSAPSVRYGQNPFILDRIALARGRPGEGSVTYPTSRTYSNHVLLDNLQPDTEYYYQVAHSNPLADNTTYSFRTARAAGDNRAFTVAMVVDLGLMGQDGLSSTVGKGAANPLAPGETNTIQRLIEEKDSYEFVIHPGDIAYSDYWLKEVVQGYLPGNISAGPELYESLLEQFYDEMQPITSSKAYMVGPGNHEANCDNGGYKNYTESICPMGQTNFTGFINHWRMPSDKSGGQGNFWYSFDYGMTHFVFFDTETDLGAGVIAPDEPGGAENFNEGPFGKTMNAQIDFLKKDLASVDRKKTPWVVAAGHRPWYVSVEPSSRCIVCQDAIEPLLNQYGVDLVVSGHVHNYERIAPIANNVTDPNELNNPTAPWYILNGAAGHYDGLDPLVLPLANYSRYTNDKTYGWSRLTFHNATHLTHEFVASGSGEVLDSATLYKQRS